jgi:hypothetical protein
MYGSVARGMEIPGRSDIDIVVLTRERDRNTNVETWRSLLGCVPSMYDVRIFELMPLHLAIQVIRRYEVVFGNPLDISEYLYGFRKEWDDVATRYEENQFSSIREKMRGITARKSLSFP